MQTGHLKIWNVCIILRYADEKEYMQWTWNADSILDKLFDDDSCTYFIIYKTCVVALYQNYFTKVILIMGNLTLISVDWNYLIRIISLEYMT